METYLRVARSGGAPEVTGPDRPMLLRKAAREAAAHAISALPKAHKRWLADRLLSEETRTSANWESLLGGHILLWCEAYWDKAAPGYPVDVGRCLMIIGDAKQLDAIGRIIGGEALKFTLWLYFGLLAFALLVAFLSN